MRPMYKLILLIAFITPTLAQAEQHLFRAYNFYSETHASCNAYADDVAVRFAEQTGFEVLGAGCEYRESTESTNIVVRYEADEAAPVVRIHRLDRYWEPSGFYSDFDECIADIANQVRIFAEYTGLDPIASYCTMSNHLRPYSWRPEITAVGAARVKPNLQSFRTNTPHYPPIDYLDESIKAKFATKGAHIEKIIWRPTMPHRKATLFGYSDFGIPISSELLVDISGIDNCAASARRLYEELNASMGNNFIAAICTSPYSGPNRFDLTLVTSEEVIDVEYSGNTFETLEECISAIPAMAERIEQVRGEAPLTSVCGRRPFSSRDPYRAAHVFR